VVGRSPLCSLQGGGQSAGGTILRLGDLGFGAVGNTPMHLELLRKAASSPGVLSLSSDCFQAPHLLISSSFLSIPTIFSQPRCTGAPHPAHLPQ
jgi:hypothetical protein